MNPKLKAILTLSMALVTALFVSGCASTGTNFDHSKVSQIKKGETTESDLIKMFGEPENRSINSDGVVHLTWMYHESTVKAESFIPYAGAFMGGTRSKAKTLMVSLGSDGKVTSFNSSGGGSETRGTTQDVPKK